MTQPLLQNAAPHRYRSLDILRGITLLSMIGYHAMWDLVYLYGLHAPWYRSGPGYLWQQSICWTFILLSGFCWGMGKHPLKRGLTVFLGGALVTAVTVLLMPEQQIIFGILTFLGTAMLLMIPLDKLTRKLPPVFGLILSLLLFFLTRNVNRGALGFEGLTLIRLPSELYRNLLTTFLGFPSPDFASTDYFSLIPWLFLFMAGHFLRKFLLPVMQGYTASHPARATGPLYSLSRPFAWLGRQSLWVYLAHQPVIYGVCTLLFSFL